LNPSGSEFQAGGKKNPLACPRNLHMASGPIGRPVLTRETARVSGGRCMGRGRGSPIFSACVRRPLLTCNARGAACPMQVEFFLKQTVKVIVILSAKTRMFLEMENAVTDCCQILSELISNAIFG